MGTIRRKSSVLSGCGLPLTRPTLRRYASISTTAGEGLGELLLLCMVDEAIARGANWLTLEVRVSNHSAQTLYRKYGFSVQGTRQRYYSDNNEDALIMWSRPLGEAAFRAEIEERGASTLSPINSAPGELAPFGGPSRARRLADRSVVAATR